MLIKANLSYQDFPRFALKAVASASIAFCILVMSSGVYAQSNTSDDMAKFLSDKGLVEKISDQVSAASRAVSDRASDLVATAMGFLGVPYKRGGNSYDQGFDCSGFVRAIYEQTVGHVLPRRAAEQAAATTPIEKSELQPGDLVFFNTLRATFSHVGIYIGDNKFIHSPRTGGVIRIEDMRIKYWNQRFDGARRVSTSTAATPARAPQAPSVPLPPSPSPSAPAPQAMQIHNQ
jgi:cell wall-associated NlpC family hydrolase